jgi:hypothetical protein
MDIYASTWSSFCSGELTRLYGVPKTLTGHTSLAYAMLYNHIEVERLPDLPQGRPIDMPQIDPDFLRMLVHKDSESRRTTDLDGVLLQSLVPDA